MAFNYDQRVFRTVQNTANGEVSADTLFRYRQQGDLVWAQYEGGDVRHGHLLAVMAADGSLDVRYHHVNSRGQLMTGVCRSVPELLPDGRYRLHESWRWTSGDGSSGESVVEEIAS